MIARKLGKGSEDSLYLSKNSRESILKRLKSALCSDLEIILQQSSNTSQPVDPFRVRKIGKAEVTVVYVPRMEISAEGSVEANSSGFLIRIDERLLSHEVRLRSTMTHELMHTFFYDVEQLPPRRLGDQSVTRKEFIMMEELCYYLSRQFLVPTTSLKNLMSKMKHLQTPSMRNLSYLKSTYDVSSEIIGYRVITDLTIWDTMFVKFKGWGSSFRWSTILKYGPNKLYDGFHTPRLLPTNSLDPWKNQISNHILNVVEHGEFQEIISIKKRKEERYVALESVLVERTNGKHPDIVTLAYELKD